MDTRTFQTAESPTATPLAQCLAELMAGSFSSSHLASFSDLPRGSVREVERHWLAIPKGARRSLISQAAELAEADVQYQFNRLFRIALTDPDSDIRRRAIAGLWEDETDSLASELIPIAESDPSMDVRAAALSFLGMALDRLSDNSETNPTFDRIRQIMLRVAAADAEPTITRRRAIESLGSLGDSSEVRQAIRNAYEHGDQALEASALTAMGRSLDARWRPVLRAVLRSEDAEIRFEAARSLGLVGNEDDAAGLADLVDDEDADVRHAAILALGEIGGPGAVRILRTLADREDEAIAGVVGEALENATLGGDPLHGSA